MKPDQNIPHWLTWARKLHAIAQSGLTYSENPYDHDRYKQILTVAAEMMDRYGHDDPTAEPVQHIFDRHAGYMTPKVDVRGVVFRDQRLLLVRETSDEGRWTLPGGWADVNETPRRAVEREIFEEAGFEARAVKLLAVYDRDQQASGLRPFPWHVYKIFFLCDIIGGAAQTSMETSEVRFFGENEIPVNELSLARTAPWQIQRFFEYLKDPSLPPDFH